MKIAIIDTDFYFANKIIIKMNRNEYKTEYFSSIHSAIDNARQSDIYLLSTDFYDKEECIQFFNIFRDKVVILMASYYSELTVRFPLDLGANDYVVKPFRMEELEQKIDYFRLKASNDSYQSYIQYSLQEIDIPSSFARQIQVPMIILTNHIIFIDKLVLEYTQKNKRVCSFISISSSDWKSKIIQSKLSDFLYISNLQLLNQYSRNILLNMLKNRKFIISTTLPIKTIYPMVELNSDIPLYESSTIMSIEEYIQFIIKTFQYKLTDTEIAKKLDFSRKSLYARRNKYAIYKSKTNNKRMIS